MSDEEESRPVIPSGGGGRGRGRGGGVPVLPTGMWESLTSSSTINAAEEDRRNEGQFDDAEDTQRRGDDHRSHQRDSGKGIERDLKGKDWECPSCSNVNWSWRTNCNACGVMKPKLFTGDGEARDGAGGGFRERQERVSTTTVEVAEDGFDDFGRRVKKTERADRNAKAEAALKRMQEKYKHLLPHENVATDATDSHAGDNRKMNEEVTVTKREDIRRDDSKNINKVDQDKRNKDRNSRDRDNRHNHNNSRDNDRNRDRSDNDRNRDRNYNSNSRNNGGKRDDSRSRRRSRSRSRSRSNSRNRRGYNGRR